MSSSLKQQRDLARLESEFINSLSGWKLSQQELESVVAARQKYASQLAELEIVLDEMERLEADAILYKMIGPVLQPTAVSSGLTQVKQRIKYVTEELQRAQTREKKLGEQQREKRLELNTMQKRLPNIPDSIYAV